MADYNCSACEELRQEVPQLLCNGFDDNMCASLMNNKGLAPSDGQDDCEDLNRLNDCLIRQTENDLNSYSSCNWKNFMRMLIPNIWTTIKAMICAICGLWKIACMVEYLMKGASFKFGEHDTEGESYIKPGKGVDFSLRHSGDEHSSDVTVTYIGGALAHLHGSLYTFTESFTDANGEERNGNTVWDFEANNFDLPEGGELLYEIRLKKSEYPQIKKFFRGEAWNSGSGQKFFQAPIHIFDGDDIPEGQDNAYAYGQHGWCNEDGTVRPQDTGYSEGHVVPKGWIYIQVRLLYQTGLNVGTHTDGAGQSKAGSSLSPRGYFGVRMNGDEISC